MEERQKRMRNSLHEKQAQLSTMQAQAEELDVTLEQLVARKRQVGKPPGPRASGPQGRQRTRAGVCPHSSSPRGCGHGLLPPSACHTHQAPLRSRLGPGSQGCWVAQEDHSPPSLRFRVWGREDRQSGVRESTLRVRWHRCSGEKQAETSQGGIAPLGRGRGGRRGVS